MKKEELIIWGATGQAIVLEEFLKEHFTIKAFFDNNNTIKSPFSYIPIFYGKKEFEKWSQTNNKCSFTVAVGGAHGKDRVGISKYLLDKGFEPINAIHPKSIIASNAELGTGTQIMMGAVIAAKVKIGDYSIINTASSIDHECEISRGCHIGPGTKLAGNIKIDEYTFIGTGAIILPNIKIGKNCVIGAGSVVTKDIPDNKIVYGNPAQIKGETNG